VRTNLPTRKLREHPDLHQLKRQAKELLGGFLAGDPGAIAEVNAHYRAADSATFALHDAQLVLARSYGFDSWPKLKAFVDGVTVKRLAEAVERGDVARVRAMLDVRPELVNTDMAENNEHRVVHYAVIGREPEMVRLLMERGADARKGIYPHRDATTALALAKERGYGEIVAIILEEEEKRRATLGGPHAIRTTAPDELAEAIAKGNEERALAMLESQPALAHACNRNGWTPLHVAAAARSEALVRWLVAHGADVNRRGPRDRTPLDRAVGNPWRNGGSVKPFEDLAGVLREHGAELTARSAVALGEAAWLRARHVEGALANPIEDWGGLLTVAVLYDKPEILTLLLDLGFDPDERVRLEALDEVLYSQGMPLWHCAATGKLEMAELLLQRGAHPNVHVYASGSPVYSAYRQGNRAMVELLERYGGVVDPITIGIFHERELAKRMLAEESGTHLPAGILEGQIVAEDLLRGAAEGGDAEIVRMALEKVDWTRDDARWHWILMQALWSENPECFGLVLGRTNPNLYHPRFRRTILHDVAGLRGDEMAESRPAMAAMLLDAGASMTERDGVLKSTPLGWACRWGRIELVKLLLERGADPVETDAEPWATPKAWAEKMGHRAVLELLRQHGG
jgi:ankyrin repeat protein